MLGQKHTTLYIYTLTDYYYDSAVIILKATKFGSKTRREPL